MSFKEFNQLTFAAYLLALLASLSAGVSSANWQFYPVSGGGGVSRYGQKHLSRTWLSPAHGQLLNGQFSDNYGNERRERQQDHASSSSRQQSKLKHYSDDIPCGTNKFQIEAGHRRGLTINEARESGIRSATWHQDDYNNQGADDRLLRRAKLRFARSLKGDKVLSFDDSYFTAMLRIAPSNAPESYCSGVIISARHVLTAAHCLSTCNGTNDAIVGPESVSGSLGSPYERWDYKLATKFSRIDVHPAYKACEQDKLSYDLAILHTRQLINFSPRVNRVCLPADSANTQNVRARFYGFGLMDDKNDGFSQWRRLNAINQFIEAKCEQYPLRYEGEMLCTNSDARQHPCPGDSGGPLIVQYNNRATLVGINTVTGLDLTKFIDCQSSVQYRRNELYKARYVSIKFLINWIGSVMVRSDEHTMPPEAPTTSQPDRTTLTSTTTKSPEQSDGRYSN